MLADIRGVSKVSLHYLQIPNLARTMLQIPFSSTRLRQGHVES